MNANQNQLIGKQPSQLVVNFPNTFKLVQLGQRRGWDVAVLGRAPMLAQPVRLKEWLLVPAHDDTSQLPTRAYKRIQTLFVEGIRPQGFVVVHEAPRQLPSGLPTHRPPLYMPAQSDLLPALSAFGKVAGSVLVATAALTGIALMSSMFVGLALLDPILVAVTTENCWVEIDRWLA